ncbi:hypothetical protein [Candidatus Jidaibacter acanthamoebae]|nr:hypothetical protein [Candidatus Jidaibacter acanthamoeba]
MFPIHVVGGIKGRVAVNTSEDHGPSGLSPQFIEHIINSRNIKTLHVVNGVDRIGHRDGVFKVVTEGDIVITIQRDGGDKGRGRG